MLYELYTYITTTSPQYVRHMDYLYEAIAMRGRYQRNRSAWQTHLDITRQQIVTAAERCHNRNKVVVLGAGLLLDVPLRELSAMFQEVALLDIVFLPEVRRKVRPYANVKLVQLDVTDMARTLYENFHSGNASLPAASPWVPAIDENTGLVVSLNILSQLWVIPRTYVLKKLRNIEAEQVDDWCRQIVESHYAFLRSRSCSVCMIADYEFVKRDPEGLIVSRASTVSGLKLPAPDASWIWNIAPRGEERQFLSTELNVGAWYFPVQLHV